MKATHPLFAGAFAVGALSFGCSGDYDDRAGEPAGKESTHEESALTTDLEMARFSVGNDEVVFLQIGEGIAVAEKTAGMSYLALMEEQGATPLELYLSFADTQASPAPDALVADHFATMSRQPLRLDLTRFEEERVARAADADFGIYDCKNIDLHATAMSRFGSNGCYTDTSGGVDSGYQKNATTAVYTYADEGYTLSSDAYLYSACSRNSKIYNTIWYYDWYVGSWLKVFNNVLIDTDENFELRYRSFGRRLLFYSFTSPNAVAVYDLAAIEKCY